MELRRALLLFAVVLGLAAIASSINRPAEDERRDEPRPSERTQADGPDRQARQGDAPGDRSGGGSGDPEGETIRFEVGGRAPERRLEPGSAATVLVSVEEPSQVRLEGLGLIQPANPLTPARFEVLAERGTESEVVVTPASGGPSEAVGTLIVREPR